MLSRIRVLDQVLLSVCSAQSSQARSQQYKKSGATQIKTAPPQQLAGNRHLLHPSPLRTAAGLAAVNKDKQPTQVVSASHDITAGMAGKALASIRNALSKIRIMAPWRVRSTAQHEHCAQ